GTNSRCADRRSNSSVGSAARRWFWLGVWGDGFVGRFGSMSVLVAEFDADAAVADEPAGPIEHRLAADAELLPRAVGIDAAEDVVEERLPRRDGGLQEFALLLVPARQLDAAHLSRQGRSLDPEHLQHRAGGLAEFPVLVLLPVPVGGQFGEAAIAGLALAQFGRALLHRVLQFPVV